MQKKTTDKKTHSEKAFTDAVTRLASEKNMDDISLKDICDEAEYTQMAFYYSFKNKDELIDRIIEGEIDRAKEFGTLVTEIQDGRISDRQMLIDIAFTEYYSYVKKKMKIYYCILNDRYRKDTIDCIVKRMTEWSLSNHTVESGEKPVDISYREYYISLDYYIFFQTVRYWVNRGCDLSEEKLYRAYLGHTDNYRPVYRKRTAE